MKKILLFLVCLLFGAGMAQAGPGDTTWVQANHVNLDYYNNFDTTVAFPDGSKTYRKIYMIFTLGQYNCPSGSQYCHQWDYTVQNYLMTRTGDTVELGRFITPFATSGWSRFGNSWQQPYVFDVTDFYPLLKDTAGVRIHYSGYSGGFTADVKFAFIEGTPDREVTGIAPLYDFSHSYGDSSAPINNYFPTKTETAPAGTQSATLKYIVTGHGNDDNGCCEFAAHAYDVNVNGSSIAHHLLWRDDCGLNDLYPQGGTWVFNRGNWCPGALVRPIYHNIPNVAAGTQYDINIQFENYSASSNFGSYTSNAIVFYYGGMNKSLDASLEDIIAPTNNPEHYRANPSGDIPQILVHNSGSTTITGIDFSYGIADSSVHSYSWQGTLAPLADTLISLPALSEITNMSIRELSGPHQFNVSITGVNGQTDEDSTNNTLSSTFNVAPLWPGDLILTLKTSNFMLHDDGSITLSNPDQKWAITDVNSNYIVARDNTASDTKYVDTVALPAAGMYKLTISSPGGAGLHWWAFDQYSQLHSGYFTAAKMDGTKIPMRNYAYSGTPHDDFGTEYVLYFTVAAPGTSAVNEIGLSNNLSIYPNPARDFIHVTFSNPSAQAVTIELFNILGQKVYQTSTQNTALNISTKGLANGIYTMRLINEGINALSTHKIVIRK
ncbi:MAG TPA: peptide-N-glycosidase F-related protein [Edaphocola sp.]|nr:peptide-N-glycosidase F-related protein [Edaphocola sp.]